MRRRRVLAVISASAGVFFTGCIGSDGGAGGRTTVAPGCTVSNTLGDAPPVPVTASGTFVEAEATMSLRWNARTQDSLTVVSSEEGVGYESDDAYTYLVFRTEVTNEADERFTVDTFNFRLEYETADYVESVTTITSRIEQLDHEVRPDETVDGVLVFAVPIDAETATLGVAEPTFADRSPVAFDTSCDESLDVALPPFEDRTTTSSSPAEG